MPFPRRLFLALAASLACGTASAAPPATPAQKNLEDFDALWRAIDADYAYIGDVREPWKRARSAWRGKAGAAKTREDFILALEGALAYLHDDHVTLSERVPRSARHVPGEADTWAEWIDGVARVTAVRASSDADVAGIRPGHVVTHVNGRPVDLVVADRLKAIGASGPEAKDWALRRMLAGPREGAVKIAVRAPDEARTLLIERHANGATANGAPLIARRMGEERDLGYIRIRNTLAEPALPAAFEAALNYVKDTKALLLDLRETMDGGSAEVANAILARIGADYRAPIVVLVDRWTAGEGEALAAALKDRASATLVGTPMAGLRGRLGEAKLPNSGIAVRFPREKAVLANGAPRESLRPAVEVDLAAPSGGPGDPILYQALKLSGPVPVGGNPRSSPARADRNGPR